MNLLKSIRNWVDGEAEDDLLSAAVFKVTPRRTAEEFIVAVAREISAVMEYERFTPPGGPIYIPRQYVVFLSHHDDREWCGEKRRGLERGLFNALQGKTRELSKRVQLAVQSISIELRVDGTLAKGQFRVRAIWESESNKTEVSARPAGSTPNRRTIGASSSEEITEVYARPRMVFCAVEVWRGRARQAIFPVTKPEITIGRGSQVLDVDLRIEGDPEVSRLHLVLARDSQGHYWLTAKGQNPVLVNDHEAPRDQRIRVMPNDEIRICSFILRIRVADRALNSPAEEQDIIGSL